MSFMKRLDNIFLKERFQKISTDIDAVFMYGQIKEDKLYLINIINLQNNIEIDFEQFETYKKITEQQFKQEGLSNIFLLNIYIVNNEVNIKNKLNENIPDYNQFLVDFHWMIILNEKEIDIPKNQPHEFLNVKKIILAVLSDNYFQNQKKLVYKTNVAYITYFIIILNCAIWLLMEWVGSSENNIILMHFGALNTIRIIYYNEYYRIITTIFLHIGFTHLFYNMFALYIFGTRVEKVLGKVKYILLYLLSGVSGSLFSLGFSILSKENLLAAGASGAIFGLQGAALYLTVKTKESLEGVSKELLCILTISGLVFGFTSEDIDNMAHIGGLIIGTLFALILYRKNKI